MKSRQKEKIKMKIEQKQKNKKKTKKFHKCFWKKKKKKRTKKGTYLTKEIQGNEGQNSVLCGPDVVCVMAQRMRCSVVDREVVRTFMLTWLSTATGKWRAPNHGLTGGLLCLLFPLWRTGFREKEKGLVKEDKKKKNEIN